MLVVWTFRRVMWATFILALVALGFWLLFQFHNIALMLFIAVVLGTVIRPIVTRLHGRGLSRPLAGILVYLVLLALVAGFALLLFPLLVEQGTTILAAVPGYLQNARAWMVNYPNQIVMRLGEFLPATMPSLVPARQTGQQMLDMAGQALGYLGSAANVAFMAIAFLLLAFHWTLDGPRTIRAWLLLLPKSQREGAGELISSIEARVSSYIAGQGILCLAIGFTALVAYLLIGLPNVLVLALVAGVLEAVPMIGPVLGAIPAAVIAFSIAPSKLIWVVVATVIIQQLENNILVPRVMRRSVGVNPFVSLLALFALSSLFGIAGALMAIPIAAIIQILFDRFLFHSPTQESEVPAGRDYASRLRYEAQALARDLRKQARLKRGGPLVRVKQIDHVMDEIEAITTDLDALLAQIPPTGAP